jgi:hypothetical protein
MDVNQLIKALDNDKNESLLEFNTKKIRELNHKVLNELDLDPDTLSNYMEKLSKYKYVDGMNEIKYGSFIRWIPITDPDHLPLKQGGVVCDIKITDSGVVLICKGFSKSHFQIKLDENLIFQKLNYQELVLLNALDNL